MQVRNPERLSGPCYVDYPLHVTEWFSPDPHPRPHLKGTFLGVMLSRRSAPSGCICRPVLPLCHPAARPGSEMATTGSMLTCRWRVLSSCGRQLTALTMHQLRSSIYFGGSSMEERQNELILLSMPAERPGVKHPLDHPKVCMQDEIRRRQPLRGPSQRLLAAASRT